MPKTFPKFFDTTNTTDVKKELFSKASKVLSIALATGLAVTSYNNREMLSNLNSPNNLNLEPNQIKLQDSNDSNNSARVSIFDNVEEKLPVLDNNCGVRSVFSALSMITSDVDSKPFLEYQSQKIGTLGMSPGMMEGFLKTLEASQVSYKGYNTSKLDQKQFQTFLVNQIKQGKVPIVLVHYGPSFHWVAIRAVGDVNLQGKSEVEIYEDFPGQQRLINRLTLDEFYEQTKLPNLIIQDTTFMLSIKGRSDNIMK